MAPPRKDISGHRFGKLTALYRSGTYKRCAVWRCKCDCGNESDIILSNLKKARSCGCATAEIVGNRARTHGHYGSATYHSWQSMKRRCDAPNSMDYKYWGGRGIGYDPRWASFENFLADMGVRADGTSLDRIDNDKNYSRENCKWSTPKEQANNRRAPCR